MIRLAVISAVLLLAGCCNQPVAPSSSLTKTEAMQYGALLACAGGRNVGELRGTSMLPVMGSNCVLLEERVRPGDIRPGDIAIYETFTSLICHRAAAVADDGSVLFKGDNNAQSDGWVSPDRIKWRVFGILFTQKP